MFCKVFVNVLFFFFQAEDGIRDWSVTGVQTCALPIYLGLRALGPCNEVVEGLEWLRRGGRAPHERRMRRQADERDRLEVGAVGPGRRETERLELRRDVLSREAAAARPGGTPLKQVVGQIAKVGVHRRGAHGRQRGCPLLAAERCERRGEQHRDSESTARRHPRAPASGQVPGSKSSCSARSKGFIFRVCCKRCRPAPSRGSPIWCGSRAVSCFWPRTPRWCAASLRGRTWTGPLPSRCATTFRPTRSRLPTSATTTTKRWATSRTWA